MNDTSCGHGARRGRAGRGKTSARLYDERNETDNQSATEPGGVALAAYRDNRRPPSDKCLPTLCPHVNQ